jgi:serine/threonine protein kinase
MSVTPRILQEPFPLDRKLNETIDIRIEDTTSASSLQPMSDMTFTATERLGAGMKGVAFRGHFTTDPEEEFVLKLPRLSLARYPFLTDEAAKQRRIQEIREGKGREDLVRHEFHVLKRLGISPYANQTLAYGRIQCDWAGSPFEIFASVQRYLPKNSFRSLDVIPRAELNENDYWLKIALGLAEALTDVHTSRVVHGDLWPPNVFVSVDKDLPGPLVKLIDFGEAFAVDSRLERYGRGTWRHAYAPPERTHRVARRAESYDVYAFGVLLMWLAFGTPGSNRHIVKAWDTYKKVKDHPQFKDVLDVCIWNQNPTYLSQLNEGPSVKISDSLRGDEYHNILQKVTIQGVSRSMAEQLFLLETVGYSEIIDSAPSSATVGPSYDEAHQAVDRLIRRGINLLQYGAAKAETIVLDPGLPPEKVSARSSSDSRPLSSSELRDAIHDRFRDDYNDYPENNRRKVLKDKPYIIDLIVSCCDHDPVKRPRMVDVLREMRDRASDLGGRPDLSIPEVVRQAQAQTDALNKLLNDQTSAFGENPLPQRGSLIPHMVAYRVNALADLTGVRSGESAGPSSLGKNLIDVYESRDVMIDHLCWLLQGLKKSDWIASASTLSVWQGRAFGQDGRYMTANVAALRRSVSLSRLFYISIQELGSNWIADLMTSLARRILGEPKEAARRKFSQKGELNLWISQSTKSNTDRDVIALEQLLRSFAEARREEHSIRTQNAAAGFPLTRGYSMTHDTRLKMRKRFLKVLKAYVFLIHHWGLHENVFANDTEGRFIINYDEFQAFGKPDLSLFLRFLPDLDSSMAQYEKTPRTLIYNRLGDSYEWIMFDSECKGRQQGKLVEDPELHRIRIYRPHLDQHSSDEGMERSISDPSEAARGLRSSFPTYFDLHDSFQRSVNILPILGALYASVDELLSKRPDSLSREKD